MRWRNKSSICGQVSVRISTHIALHKASPVPGAFRFGACDETRWARAELFCWGRPRGPEGVGPEVSCHNSNREILSGPLHIYTPNRVPPGHRTRLSLKTLANLLSTFFPSARNKTWVVRLCVEARTHRYLLSWLISQTRCILGKLVAYLEWHQLYNTA